MLKNIKLRLADDSDSVSILQIYASYITDTVITFEYEVPTIAEFGKALYFSLFEILKLQGYFNIYAAVTVPNIRSEGLHESFGFKTIGVYKNVGYKFGRWHDVKWYELKIKEHIQSPIKPKMIDEVDNTKEFKSIIEKAEQMIID